MRLAGMAELEFEAFRLVVEAALTGLEARRRGDRLPWEEWWLELQHEANRQRGD